MFEHLDKHLKIHFKRFKTSSSAESITLGTQSEQMGLGWVSFHEFFAFLKVWVGLLGCKRKKVLLQAFI